jgi:hypothetical protein
MVMDNNSILLTNSGCRLNQINQSHDLIKKGAGYAELSSHTLLLSLGSEQVRLSLDDILYMSVEQNHKITFTTTKGIHQLVLKQASALQWKNYIKRLKKGEQPVRSLA